MRQLPKPSQLISYLDRFVTGQAKAKRDLATAVYTHYMGLAYRASFPDPQVSDFGKQHVLMMGPTGSGKTYLVKKLGEYLKVPVAFCSATALVQAGYRGQEIESIVSILLEKAGRNVGRAERGIIFLDEIDKIRRIRGWERDITGEGVQNGLLTMLDGTEVRGVNTSNVLFIATGAFADLPGIIQRRLGQETRAIGFGGDATSAPKPGCGELLRQATLADLVEFGFIPEFVGRFGVITTVMELDVASLTEILLCTENSVIKGYQEMARLHGIDLVFEDEAVKAVAEAALQMGTHARGLNSVLITALCGVGSQIPDMVERGVSKIIVTAESVRNGVVPQIQEGVPRDDVQFRLDALRNLAFHPVQNYAEEDTPEMLTNAEKRAQFKETVAARLSPETASPQALAFWNQMVQNHEKQETVLLRLGNELSKRGSTIAEFYHAHLCCGEVAPESILAYLDYLRVRSREACTPTISTAAQGPEAAGGFDEESAGLVTIDTSRFCAKLKQFLTEVRQEAVREHAGMKQVLAQDSLEAIMILECGSLQCPVPWQSLTEEEERQCDRARDALIECMHGLHRIVTGRRRADYRKRLLSKVEWEWFLELLAWDGVGDAPCEVTIEQVKAIHDLGETVWRVIQEVSASENRPDGSKWLRRVTKAHVMEVAWSFFAAGFSKRPESQSDSVPE
ncbi:MAG: AAA family ATPase [Verrucomicrobiales bacterium]|nr:AAA family ATPase [Verrucomicrobiales bacterium]